MLKVLILAFIFSSNLLSSDSFDPKRKIEIDSHAKINHITFGTESEGVSINQLMKFGSLSLNGFSSPSSTELHLYFKIFEILCFNETQFLFYKEFYKIKKIIDTMDIEKQKSFKKTLLLLTLPYIKKV